MPPYRGDYEKLVADHNSVEEEEEALSLCDLPIKDENQQSPKIQQSNNKTQSSEVEDFEFGSSWVGSLLTESEICAADDVFFQGQILPLRLSVSSESGFQGTRQDSRNPSRCGSRSESTRSESLDHCSSGVYTSRSSSSKSIHSSASNTTTTTATTTSTTYKPLKNIFHSHPSPKPQVWNSGSRPSNVRVRTGKSTTWGLFRVGLVKTPQIELQDLKLRNNKSFNSSCSSSSSNSIKNVRLSVSSNNGSKGSKNETKLEKKKMQRFLFESCKCSVDAVESTVSSKIVVIKNINNNSNNNNNNKKMMMMMSGSRELMKEEESKEEKEKDEKEKQGKQKEMNHRRTFEWLKELSIAGVPDEA